MKQTLLLTTFLVLAISTDSIAQQIEPLALNLHGVHFVQNNRQWSDPEIRFGFKSRGLDIAFRQSSFSMHLAAATQPKLPEPELNPPDSMDRAEDKAVSDTTLTVTFPNSNPVIPTGINEQTARFNYFIGDNEALWASDVASFATVVYEHLYDGIDLHVMGDADGIIKYEFHCAPGADYSQIQIRYDGIESLCIGNDGSLHISSSVGILNDANPQVWQTDLETAEQIDVPARFELVDTHTYRFQLDNPIDPTNPLVVDPDIEWMYYIGSPSLTYADAIAVDSKGAIYVAGRTNTGPFEGQNNEFHGGSFDAYVVKKSPLGETVWMTFLGGSGSDYGKGLALDRQHQLLVIGTTDSIDFSGRRNAHRGDYDAFVVRLTTDGQLEWMTYVGGTDLDGAQQVVIDNEEALWIVGSTESTDFESRINSHHGGGPENRGDAFVARLDTDANIQWMRYLGGGSTDVALDVAPAGSGNVVVVGTTWSTNFEGRSNEHNGSNDAFAAGVSADGEQVLWAYFIGGDRHDTASAVTAADNNSFYMVGSTDSLLINGHRSENHGLDDAFVTRFDSTGEIQWVTHLGGSRNDFGSCIAIDAEGFVIVGGANQSSDDFEGRINNRNNQTDPFLARLDTQGLLRWAAMFGGSGQESATAVAIGPQDSMFLAGNTRSDDFVGRRNERHGAWDGFLLKFRFGDEPVILVESSCPDGGPIEILWANNTLNGVVAFIYGMSVGETTIPSQFPCAGTSIGLERLGIRFVGDKPSGPDGRGSIAGILRSGVCGGYLQLLDLTTCKTSNVVCIE